MKPWTHAAADLIIGAACSGCRRPGVVLCQQCREFARPEPHSVELDPMPFELDDAPDVDVWASGPYRLPLRGMLVDFKEHGKFGLRSPLGYQLASAVAAAAGDATRVTLVPIPSRRVTSLRRGYDAVAELAMFSSGVLAGVGLTAHVVPRLALIRRVRDQGGLTGRQRRRNVHEAMQAVSCQGRSNTVIVVDDIVTTGSTAAEAVRALGSKGPKPVAVAAVATTAQQWRWLRRCAAEDGFES